MSFLFREVAYLNQTFNKFRVPCQTRTQSKTKSHRNLVELSYSQGYLIENQPKSLSAHEGKCVPNIPFTALFLVYPQGMHSQLLDEAAISLTSKGIMQ